MEKVRVNKGKRILGYVLAVMMMLSCILVPGTEAKAEDLILGLSSSTVKIGDTVTVSIIVPAGVTATINLTYSSDIFQYSSASETANANGGTVSMTLGGYGANNSRTTGTVTFKAKSAGNGSFAVSAPNAGNQDGDRVTVGGASARVTVKNETNEKTDEEQNNDSDSSDNKNKSADNSLASLTLSDGSLSPSFKYNVTSYTAEVDYDVTSLAISAKPSNANATIESVKGGEKLSVGANKVQIVVKAENGVTATYTITVTRKAQEEQEEEPEVDSEADDTQENSYDLYGVKLYPATSIPQEIIPEGFVQETITLWEKEYPCLHKEEDTSSLRMLYLVDENGENGALYMISEETPYEIYPFVCMNYEQYMHSVMEEEETEKIIEQVPAPEPDNSKQKLEELQRSNRMMLFVFIVVILLLLVIIIALLIKKKGNEDDFFGDDEELDDFEEEKLEMKKPEEKKSEEKKSEKELDESVHEEEPENDDTIVREESVGSEDHVVKEQIINTDDDIEFIDL